MTTTNPWAEFYEKRINSSYQDYFNRRYEALIELIHYERPTALREEGVGIGSVSKALNLSIEHIYGFDLDEAMLELCAKNNPRIKLYQDCIINTEIGSKGIDMIVTHGVLEHFADNNIKRIFSRYKKQNVKNVHYVPTDGYDTPSFGDERLLPFKYWLNKFRPKDYMLFNEDKDLILINV